MCWELVFMILFTEFSQPLGRYTVLCPLYMCK